MQHILKYYPYRGARISSGPRYYVPYTFGFVLTHLCRYITIHTKHGQLEHPLANEIYSTMYVIYMRLLRFIFYHKRSPVTEPYFAFGIGKTSKSKKET